MIENVDKKKKYMILKKYLMDLGLLPEIFISE